MAQAVRTGDVKYVLEVLDAGACITEQSGKHRNTALHFAAIEGQIDLLPILFEAGSNINETNARRATALHFAILNAKNDVALALLELGADPLLVVGRIGNAYAIAQRLLAGNRPSCSPYVLEKLRIACSNNAPPVAIPLYKAVQRGNETLVTGLLSQGADPNARDANGCPLLVHASHNNTHNGVRIIIKLVRAGADVNAPDSSGMSALHHAAKNGTHRTLIALISAHANVNIAVAAKGKKCKGRGNTPLHYAALEGHRNIAKALLDAGADKTIRNAAHYTAAYVAQKAKHLDIVELLA